MPHKPGPFQLLLQKQPLINPPQMRAERVNLIKKIQTLRGRPLIVYATNVEVSGPGIPAFINPQDIVPLNEVVASVEGDEVDILLETPGGLAEVTIDIVNLLRPRFKKVGFIIPHCAMSAGTILVMSGDEILMDYRSSLGAIDPQFIGPDGRPQPAQAILTGIETIKEQIDKNKGVLHPVYIPILRNVDPGRLQSAENASKLSRDLVSDWLVRYKFKQWLTHESDGRPVTEDERAEAASKVAQALCEHQTWLSHARPIKIPELRTMGLKITDYGDSAELQENIWALWVHLHFFMATTNIYKIYESTDAEFYKVAVMQAQPPQVHVPQKPAPPVPTSGPRPAPGVSPSPLPNHALAAITCNSCGTPYRIQLNFKKNEPIQLGAEAFPKSGLFPCRVCNAVHNLSGLKMQVEATTRRSVIL